MMRNTELLIKATEQAIDELQSDFKLIKESDNGGWHQFLGSDKVGNVATSQALLLLRDFKSEFKDTRKALNFLLYQQISGKGKNDIGGWSYVSNVQDVANTEATSWSIQALSEWRDEKIEKCGAIDAGMKWLKQNFINNEKYSGWGPTNESGFRTYSTCMAMNTFIKLSQIDNQEYKRALDTLKRIQNEDGGWGAFPNDNSTVTHTAHAVITLINAGIKTTSRLIERALIFLANILKSKIYENGSHMGYNEMFDFVYSVKGKKKMQRITLYHMPLPYAMQALLKGNYSDRSLVAEVTMHLVQSSDHGIWRHPFLFERPLWAMYDVLQLFKTLTQSFPSDDFDAFVNEKKSKKKYDVIIFTVVPVEFLTLNKILGFAPDGKREDFSINNLWYYEHDLNDSEGNKISCLITMVGSAGDVSCYSACSTTFSEFDCNLAILCGIAAGNREELKKYSVVIAESVVAYEFQRLEKSETTYRPKFYNVLHATQKLIEKRDFYKEEWNKLIQEFVSKTQIKIEEVKEYKIDETELKSGIIASGAKLIADGKTLEVLRREIPIGKGIVAAEMEGSGFAPCCIENNKEWLIFRGISDYGEDDKNDPDNKKHQPIAVATAAATVIYYLRYFYRANTGE